MGDQILTIQQAADYLGVSTKTLMRWEEKGTLIPERTAGNQRRYKLEELRAFKQKSKTTSPIPETNYMAPPTIQTPVIPTMPLAQNHIKTAVPGIIHREDLVSTPITPIEARDSFFTKKVYKKSFLQTTFFVLSALFIVGALSAAFAYSPDLAKLLGFAATSSTDQKNQNALSQPLSSTKATALEGDITFNIASIYNAKTTFNDLTTINKDFVVNGKSLFNEDIKVANKNVDLGTGKLTAANVVYGVTPGSNIIISGDPQNPTVSSIVPPSVTSLQGLKGELTLLTGSGIGVDGLTIKNTGVLSVAGQTGDVSLTKGTGIEISGTTISNSDKGSDQNIFKSIIAGTATITAGSNSDALTFVKGTGIDITADTSGKSLTFSVINQFSGLSTNGIIYADSGTTLSSLTPGASGYVLQSNGGGSPPSWVPSILNGSFTALTSGTNTQAAMVVGSGASLDYTGTGTINATTVTGLNLATGKTLTVNNSLTLAGSDSATFTFPGAGGTVVTEDQAQVLTNKTIDAGSNTITNLTNANLSGTAGITNANLANSSLSVTGGNGISGGGSVSLGGSTSFALGALTGDWNQTGAFDIVLNNAASELKILESAGGTFFGSIDVGDLTADRLYTLPNGSGSICVVETGNCAGSGTGVTTSGGTTDRMVKFSATQAIVDASIKDLYNAGVAMTIDSAGKIGIGTASPSALLHVIGGTTGGNAAAIVNQTGASTNDIFAASSSGTTRFVINNNGNIQFTGNSGFLQTLTSSAVAAKSFNFPTFTGSSTDICLASGNCAGVNGNGDITGVGSMLSGDAFANSTADDQWLGLGASAGRIEFDDQTTDEVNILNAKLGVGTATPDGLLHINGTVPGKALVILNDTGGDQNILTASASGTTVLTLDRSGNLSVSGSVGIGTYSPTAKLDVVGTASISGQLSLSGTSVLQSTANKTLTIGGNTTGDILFKPGNSAASLFLGSNGSAGIGTTNTGSQLLTVGSGTTSLIPSTVKALTTHASDARIGTAVNNAGVFLKTDGISAGLYTYNYSTNTPLNLTLNEFGGNIITGVANQTPLASLDIRGTSGTLPAASVSGQTTNAALVVDNNGTGDLFTASKSGATKFVITNAGNVGIGTANPGASLDLATSGTILGAGLSTDCSTDSSKLQWSSTTKQFVCGTDNNVSATEIVRKTADETVTSSTVLQNDDELKFHIGANESWVWTMYVPTNIVSSTPGIKYTFTAPGGAVFCRWSSSSADQGSTDSDVDCGTSGEIPGLSGDNFLEYSGTVTNGATPGDIQFQWTQQTSSGNATTVKAGSFIVAHKVQTGAENYFKQDGNSFGGLATLGTNDGNSLAFKTNGTEWMRLNTTGSLGLGTTNPLATLDIRGNSGTDPVASFTGQTAKAGLLVDNSGVGDLFTASKSGATKFLINNAGDVKLAAGQTIDTLTAGTLGIGTSTQNGLTLGRSGAATTINGSSLTVGATSWTATPTISGLITANGGVSVANGQNLTLGSLTSNNNSVLFTNGSGTVGAVTTASTNQCLISQGAGAAPIWGTCNQGNASWASVNGAIFPGNSTQDLLIGGVSSSSAKFAILGVNNGTPVASIAASTNNSGIYLDAANGAIQSTRMNTLTIGGANTGNIVLNSGSGFINIMDATTLAGNFTQSGATTFNTGSGLTTLGGNLTVNGTALTFANNSTLTLGSSTTALNIDSNLMNFDTTNNRIGIGTSAPLATFDVRGLSGTTPAASISGVTSKAALLVDNSGVGDLFAASKSGASKFVIKNSGKVGIGTTLPSEALEINGNVLIQNSNWYEAKTAGGATATVMGIDSSNNVLLNNSSSGNALTISTSTITANQGLVLSSTSGEGLSGGGLTDCDATNSKLLWDSSTNQFSCGTDRGAANAYQSVDQTESANTLTNSSLTFTIGANETYIIQANLSETNSGNLFRYAISAPSGATCNINGWGSDDTGSGIDSSAGGAGCGTARTYDGGKAISMHTVYGYVTTGGTGGSVTLQFADNGGTSATLKAGSTLYAFKVTGADYAETYYTKDMSIISGDVVSLDSSLQAGVKKSTNAYQQDAVGIISTQPGHVIGDAAGINDGKPVPLALSGRVPVKVSTMNGPIHAGDYLTTSSIPGVAMKATRAGQMIAKAMTDFDPENTHAQGTVMAFVNLSYADPSANVNGDPEASSSADLTKIYLETVTLNSKTEGLTDRIASIEAKLAEYDTVILGSKKEGLNYAADSAAFDPMAFNNRIASSSAFTSQTTSTEDKLETLNQRLSLLELQASASAMIGNDTDISGKGFTASSGAELGLDKLEVNNATVSNNLSVLGRTLLSDVGITGQMTIGLMSINGLDDDGFAAINTVAGPLKLQTTGLNGIDILNGKLTIDNKGNLKTSGELTTNKINIATEDVAGASLGEAHIESGKLKVSVKTAALTKKSKIFVEPQEVPVVTAVKKVADDTFEIRIRTAEEEDIKLNWWIVN